MNTIDYKTTSAQMFAGDATVVLAPKSNLLLIPKKKKPIVDNAAPAVAVVNAVTAQGDASLVDRVHKIENLDKATAIKRVLECEDKVAETYFELGGALSVIRNSGWFDPYKTFDEWVEVQTEMGRSKAHSLIQIYDALANSDLPWSKASHLGWTKLRRIARVLTKDSADHWIEVASTHSRRELAEIVKEHLASHCDEHPETAPPTHKRTFALHDDQNATVEAALKKAMKDAGTVVPSEALSLICLDYLGGCSLAERLKHHNLKAVQTALFTAFPHFAKQIVISDGDDQEEGS